jgi:hypothetical protein
MKSIGKYLLIFSVAFSALTGDTYAQSPREELQQMVGQLQKTPNDNALREKVIKLASTLKPAPALPDTANAFEGRAQVAFRTAKSEDELIVAAREYEKAVAAAPWVFGYYADLCTIYEKAGKLEDAKRHCGFYLIGLIDPAQMAEVKRRIAGLEFGIEKANSPQTAKAVKPAGPDFSGNWYNGFVPFPVYIIEKNGVGWIVRDANKTPLRVVKAQGRQLWIEEDMSPNWLTTYMELVLSEDGQTIDKTSKMTQSVDQFNRMNRESPGGRMMDLDRYQHSKLRRK